MLSSFIEKGSYCTNSTIEGIRVPIMKRTVGIVTRTCSQVFPDSYFRPHFTLRIPLEDLDVASKKKKPPVPDLHNLKGR